MLAVGVLAKSRDVGPDLGRKHSARHSGLKAELGMLPAVLPGTANARPQQYLSLVQPKHRILGPYCPIRGESARILSADAGREGFGD